MRWLLLVTNLLILIVFLLRFSTMPPQIPLFYSKPWGEAQLVDWWMILLLPVIMNAVYIANTIIKKRFYPENEFADRVLHYLTIFAIISFTFVFIKIIFLVT